MFNQKSKKIRSELGSNVELWNQMGIMPLLPTDSAVPHLKLKWNQKWN